MCCGTHVQGAQLELLQHPPPCAHPMGSGHTQPPAQTVMLPQSYG